MKVVSDLAKQGLLQTTRGRGGGLRLSKEPGAIRIGAVVRASESDFRLVECFDATTNACTLTPTCRLKHVFDSALRGYFQALDDATLADLTAESAGPESGPYGRPARGTAAAVVAMPPTTRPVRKARSTGRN